MKTFIYFIYFQSLTEATLPEFVERLSRITSENEDRITDSAANIESITTILNNIANASQNLIINVEVFGVCICAVYTVCVCMLGYVDYIIDLE